MQNEKNEFTLAELAELVGMSARNVRAYQTKGLIPPPGRAGRRSAYGREHLTRLQAIEEARRRGASLSLIRAHLDAGRSLDDDTLVSWAHGAPRDVPGDVTALLAELDHLRDAAAGAHLDELTVAGVLRPHADRVVADGELAEILHALHRRGFGLGAALAIAQRTLVAAAPLASSLAEATGAEATGACVARGEATKDDPTGDDAVELRRQLISLACHVFRHALVSV